MSAITHSTGDNYGGLQAIQYAFAVPLAADLDILTAIDGAIDIPQAVIDAHFFTIAPTLETAEHQEVEEQTADGVVHSQTVGLRLVGDKSEIRAQKRAVKNKGLVLLVTDHNGTIRLVGTTTEPLYQTDDRRTGIRLADTNGSNFLITGRTTDTSLIVTIT